MFSHGMAVCTRLLRSACNAAVQRARWAGGTGPGIGPGAMEFIDMDGLVGLSAMHACVVALCLLQLITRVMPASIHTMQIKIYHYLLPVRT